MVTKEEFKYMAGNETKALLAAIKSSRDSAMIHLCLDAGLSLGELVSLNIDSMDWEHKLLRIAGDRKRDIPVNDELYASLSAWSHDRIDNPSEAFFVTSRGSPRRLSTRAIGKLLLKKKGFRPCMILKRSTKGLSPSGYCPRSAGSIKYREFCRCRS